MGSQRNRAARERRNLQPLTMAEVYKLVAGLTGRGLGTRHLLRQLLSSPTALRLAREALPDILQKAHELDEAAAAEKRRQAERLHEQRKLELLLRPDQHVMELCSWERDLRIRRADVQWLGLQDVRTIAQLLDALRDPANSPVAELLGRLADELQQLLQRYDVLDEDGRMTERYARLDAELAQATPA